ncbi:MAG: MBL fold metallo-hydrolase, partial [Leptospira sp.]|nr:MBL fold metallo-hydrolase [Leptospira sp.]
MADVTRARAENIPGNFYVDSTCIDCDTCRWIAPESFHRSGGQSFVFSQPNEKDHEILAFQALLACPTSSIGAKTKSKYITEARNSFPVQISENVFYCGYHSEQSFGAASYFIQRKGGNILIDSPRFNMQLAKKLEALGGISYMFLTHIDDIADHAKFHSHFGCKRIIQKDDFRNNSGNFEIVINDQEELKLFDDLIIIPVPGHTKGHSVLLYKDKFLFTGDHLAWSVSLKQLHAFRNACWYSWKEQIRSMTRLLNYSFEWVLPGHGRRYHAN